MIPHKYWDYFKRLINRETKKDFNRCNLTYMTSNYRHVRLIPKLYYIHVCIACFVIHLYFNVYYEMRTSDTAIRRIHFSSSSECSYKSQLQIRCFQKTDPFRFNRYIYLFIFARERYISIYIYIFFFLLVNAVRTSDTLFPKDRSVPVNVRYNRYISVFVSWSSYRDSTVIYIAIQP